jgi:divalent metal cation (Fe/Co/Zn/Cd) transporter
LIAILFPKFIIVDSAAGILLSGIISLTGIEILVDSIKHLTDTMDRDIEKSLASFAIKGIEGIQKISKIRSRGNQYHSLIARYFISIFFSITLRYWLQLFC